jgi:hypothetical protein
VHASDAWLPKRRAGSATTHTSKLPSRCAPPRFRFPESAKHTPISSFPENGAGSIHGPRSHEARSTSRLPARSLRPHCAGRPYSEVDLQPQFPRANDQPQARVARTMKLLPSFRLPDAPTPTSLHGASVGELLLHPVSRASKPPNHTGHPNSRATAPPGFPSGEAAPAARVAYALEPTSTLRLPETSTLAPSHRLLELWNLRSPLGCPNDGGGPTALIRR